MLALTASIYLLPPSNSVRGFLLEIKMKKNPPRYSVFVTLFFTDTNGKSTEQSLVTTHCPTNAKNLSEIAAYTRLQVVTGFNQGQYIIGERKAFVKVYSFIEVAPEDYQVLEKYMDVTYINKEQVDAWWNFKSTHS